MKAKPSDSVFARWGRRINWKRRVKAVCKPCWEIKYCPYGPLVEQFPLREAPDPRSCRIFGHDCPVFHCAEPLTETKELRRISRDIPRPTQFRVLKRENQICSACGQSVQDDDVHFDHVIPYAKGGSSDESNVRLLCDICNQKRSDRFEAEFLVRSSNEHLVEHSDLTLLDLLLDTARYVHDYRRASGMFPDAKRLGDEFNGGESGYFEERVAGTFADLQEFFSSKRPTEMTARQMKALRRRWGYEDGRVRLLGEVAAALGESVDTMVIMERSLLSRAGWYLREDKHSRRKWTRK